MISLRGLDSEALEVIQKSRKALRPGDLIPPPPPELEQLQIQKQNLMNSIGATLNRQVSETVRIWRKHHLGYGQTKYVVEQARRRLKLQPQGTRRRAVDRLDKSEVERLIRSTYQSHNKYGLMIKTLFLSEARVDEFVHIRVEDLHLDGDPPQMRPLALVTAMLFGQAFGFGQSTDWGTLFRDGASDIEAKRDRVRQKGADELLPKLMSEGGNDVQIDAGAIAEQLKSEAKEVRTQASGYLFCISSMRQDSAYVLRPVFSAIQNHFSDSVPIVRLNSVNAISLLSPTIPEDQIRALVELIGSEDKGLTRSALMGVARMINKDGFAYETLDRIIAGNDALTASAIQALTATHSFNERLTRHIVPLSIRAMRY